MPYTPPCSQSVLLVEPRAPIANIYTLHDDAPATTIRNAFTPETSTSTSVKTSSSQRVPITLKLNLGQHSNVIARSNGQPSNKTAQNSKSNSISFPTPPLEEPSQVDSRLSQRPAPLIAPPNAIRKKSGELVKPSLKSSSSYRSKSSTSAPSSPGLTEASLLSTPSISSLVFDDDLPVQTPSKMVHFDSQLEHIRLFKREQKPAAVSRDGSPDLTTDTEGEDGSGVEYFGYKMPRIAGQRARANSVSYSGPRRKVVKTDENEEEDLAKRIFTSFLNFSCPSSLPPSGPLPDAFGFSPISGFADYAPAKNVSLSSLELRYCSTSSNASKNFIAEDEASQLALSLEGTVIVRNVAFDKQVTVRFTLDEWQTVCEVGGQWIRSVEVLQPHTPSFGHVESNFGNDIGSCLDHFGERRDASEPKTTSADVFSFSIKLSDHLLRITSKTLVSTPLSSIL